LGTSHGTGCLTFTAVGCLGREQEGSQGRPQAARGAALTARASATSTLEPEARQGFVDAPLLLRRRILLIGLSTREAVSRSRGLSRCTGVLLLFVRFGLDTASAGALGPTRQAATRAPFRLRPRRQDRSSSSRARLVLRADHARAALRPFITSSLVCIVVNGSMASLK
jgi:hypothetical protein